MHAKKYINRKKSRNVSVKKIICNVIEKRAHKSINKTNLLIKKTNG
jgi:hypothetical protein